MTTSSPSTEAMWAERVRAWRSSGKTASAFANEHGLTLSTLRYWTARLTRKPAAPAMVRLLPKSTMGAQPAESTPTTDLVVEVGAARIRVSRGFDAEVLAAVVRVLGGAR